MFNMDPAKAKQLMAAAQGGGQMPQGGGQLASPEMAQQMQGRSGGFAQERARRIQEMIAQMQAGGGQRVGIDRKLRG